jgi:hypothetical protein
MGHDEGVLITACSNVNNLAELAECGVHSLPHTLSGPEQRKILGGLVRREPKKAEAALCLRQTGKRYGTTVLAGGGKIGGR